MISLGWKGKSNLRHFSLENYKSIIFSFLENGYQIVPLGAEAKNSGKILYLRHDVDFSLDLAIKLAEVNYQLGVKGCFFLMVRSSLYNLVEETSQEYIKSLKILDQTLGLHFCLPFSMQRAPVQDLGEVHRLIWHDFELLNNITGKELAPAMSWHNPSNLGEKYRDCVEAAVPGLLNAYSLPRKGVAYMADSNFRFSVESWLKTARKGPNIIQTCFHPFQWVWNTTSMEKVLANMWIHLIRKKEKIFLSNHVYRSLFPAGLPEAGLHHWVAPLLESTDFSDQAK